MIDIHCHMIPWIDDGAPNARTACEMAEYAYRSGVHTMIVTPHCAIPGAPENYRGRQYSVCFSMFRALLKQRDIPLRILPGCELFASTPYLKQILEQRRAVTLNHSRYLLTEFNFHASAQEISSALQLIEHYGYIPVVAHPERYRAVQDSPQLATEWFSRRYVLQVNKGSLLGRLGSGAQETAMHLLRCGLIHVIASDTHDPRYRPTGFQSLLPLLDRHCSPEYIELMLEINPHRILSDRRIPLPRD